MLGVQEVASSSLVTPTIQEHGRRCHFRIDGCFLFSAIGIFLAIVTCIILTMSYPKKRKKPLTEVMIYTDGACSGNPGPGGWAAIIIAQGVEKELSGFDADTTNNRMELTAAIKALQALKRPCRVHLYSDSAYLVSAFNENWIINWHKNGWKNAAKMPVANQDLWQALWEEHLRHEITWYKVRGHADNEFNNRCDKMAVNEIQRNT